MTVLRDRESALREAALHYHQYPTPGKVAIVSTKQLTNQADLALACTLGVAAACDEIVADPITAFQSTSRGNLEAVCSKSPGCAGACGQALVVDDAGGNKIAFGTYGAGFRDVRRSALFRSVMRTAYDDGPLTRALPSIDRALASANA